MFKIDIRRAFRHIRDIDWALTIMTHILTPFCHSGSTMVCNFSAVFQWYTAHNLKQYWFILILFISVYLLKSTKHRISLFIYCQILYWALVSTKLVPAIIQLTCLGILVDSQQIYLCYPPKKCQKLYICVNPSLTRNLVGRTTCNHGFVNINIMTIINQNNKQKLINHFFSNHRWLSNHQSD